MLSIHNNFKSYSNHIKQPYSRALVDIYTNPFLSWFKRMTVCLFLHVYLIFVHYDSNHIQVISNNHILGFSKHIHQSLQLFLLIIGFWGDFESMTVCLFLHVYSKLFIVLLTVSKLFQTIICKGLSWQIYQSLHLLFVTIGFKVLILDGLLVFAPPTFVYMNFVGRISYVCVCV